MVIIANRPVEAEQISGDYPQGSVERIIINKMSDSEEKYEYASIDELKFELLLRKQLVQAARDLNKSNMAFEVFRDARANPTYWEITREGGFLLKSGVKPSDAIRDIYINGSKYGTECATAMVIVYYKALLEIYPEELFNRTFSKVQLMNWRYIDRNLDEIGVPKRAKDFLPGDRLYVANPDVDPLTPEWQGENVIDLGNGQYYGHGMGILPVDRIIYELNRVRRAGAERSAYLLDSAARPNFKRLGKIYADYFG